MQQLDFYLMSILEMFILQNYIFKNDSTYYSSEKPLMVLRRDWLLPL